MNRGSIVNALNSLGRILPDAKATVILHGRRHQAIRTTSHARSSVFSESDLSETERYGVQDYKPDRIPERFDPVEVKRKGITTKRVITSAKRDPLDASLIIGTSSPFDVRITINGKRHTKDGPADILASLDALVVAQDFSDLPAEAIAQTTDRDFTVWVRSSDLDNLFEPQTGDGITLTAPENVRQSLNVITAIRKSQCWVLTCRTTTQLNPSNRFGGL